MGPGQALAPIHVIVENGQSEHMDDMDDGMMDTDGHQWINGMAWNADNANCFIFVHGRRYTSARKTSQGQAEA